MCAVTLVAVISAVADVLPFPNGHPFMHTPTHVTQCANFISKNFVLLSYTPFDNYSSLQTTVTLPTVRCPEEL